MPTYLSLPMIRTSSVRQIKWRKFKVLLVWLMRMKRFIINRLRWLICHRRLISCAQIAALFSAFYQWLTHYKWWTGFFESICVFIFHHRPHTYSKEVFTASDGENYAVYTPKKQSSLYYDVKGRKSSKDHIWLCLPGGMEPIDPAMEALRALGAFKGSKICMFNNPGISTSMIHKPLISPTSTKYVIEYIKYLQSVHNLSVSLIGFSIGSVQALRTLHKVLNDDKLSKQINIKSVVLVHGPDKVKDAVCSTKQNWLIRMDVFFAFHILYKHYQSNSWPMIKAKINEFSHAFQGWKFIEHVTSVTLNKDWKQCEQQMFNLRNFCDVSIESVPVLRVIAKNDFVVPFQSIDSNYFKHFKDVLISDHGGHCGVNRCNQTIEKIRSWNKQILIENEREKKVEKMKQISEDCLNEFCDSGSVAC